MASIVAVRPKSDFALCQAFLDNKSRHPVTHARLTDEERSALERYFASKGFRTTRKEGTRIHPGLPAIEDLTRRHPEGILGPNAVHLVPAQTNDATIDR